MFWGRTMVGGRGRGEWAWSRLLLLLLLLLQYVLGDLYVFTSRS